VKVTIKTNGYAGRKMSKSIKVVTDDPDNEKFSLIFKGNVDSVVAISPKTVKLNGKPGDELEKAVTITPSFKYFFSITDLEQKFNKNIKARLIRPESKEKPWQVLVKASSNKVDDLYEVITLKTDSKYQPKLKIRVYAIFAKQTSQKTGS
jgi:hypothetical protein